MNDRLFEKPAKNTRIKRVRASSRLPEAFTLEAEIDKLAGELHDGIGQAVTALKFMIETIANSPDKDIQLINDMRRLVQQTQVDVRHLYNGIQTISNKIKTMSGNTKKY